jgi:NAD(P)-dependent dehydrogenase (short-subunit alcohol dehydrogenase family)
VYVLKAAWPHLVKAKYGRVVNTCSEGAFGIHPMVTGYAGGKGGVFGLTRVLATEGYRDGILVNAIAPRASTRLGSTESVVKVFGTPVDQVERIMAMMRPELVAPAAAFLAHESCNLAGEVLVAGAGQVQRLILSATKGIYEAALTPEYISANVSEMLDTTDATLIGVNTEILQAASIR